MVDIRAYKLGETHRVEQSTTIELRCYTLNLDAVLRGSSR